MRELSSVLALSGLLALASAQDPAALLNSVCFPSGQLKNTIPYPCPGIANAKDQCNQFLPGPNATPEQLKKHRDCLCFDQKIIQFEKGCTACKKTHAFLSKRGEGYWNGILDRVYSDYCQAETPTAAYDASWASASQAAGPYPTGGPDDVLINYAKDLPADDKTKVELYWKGTTEERRPSATAAPTSTSVSTSAAATPTLVDDDDDEWCDDEETTSASAGSAAATTASPNTAVSGSIQPTPVLNNDWISASCKQDPSASTVRPPQPSQSGWTKQNETSPAPATETVYVDRVIILMVCQKCVYAKSDNGDYQLACANPMEVEGTKKQVPVEEAKHLPAVPVALPKEPVSVEQKKKIVVPDTIIQQVCGCSYTSGPGSNGNGVNGSNPGSSKNPGSGSDGPKNNGPTGSNGSNGPNGSGNEGPNGSNGKPGSGNNGANGPNGSTGSPSGPGNNGANGSNGPNGSTGSGPDSPKNNGSNGSNGPNGSTGSPSGPGNNGSNGPNGSTGSPSGLGNEGANGSNGKPGSGNNGANGANPGSPNAPGSGNTGAGSDAGSPKNPGSNGPNNAGSNGAAAPSGSNPSKPTRVGSAGLPSGTNQVPLVSSASGNMPASVAMLFLAAMALLI